MNMQDNLRALAQSDIPAAPFGFDEFEQRRARAAARRRTAFLSTAGSVAALGVVSSMALVTQSPPHLQPDVVPALQVALAPESAELPALVNLDRFDVTTELEDHIAVIDAQLSAARVQSAPASQLRQLENTRTQLSESLQRVTYAHSLLSL
jgi:hypothetical protein